jgi:aryl-alcohol dehydrogenase-like predicted oxidoreductase
VELGCNFFDTAWAYGNGRSEKLLGELLRASRGKKIFVATKIPPKNFIWPGQAKHKVGETFPPDHIREYTEKSLQNLGVDAIDLTQFHVWDDSWAEDERWQREVEALKREKLIRAFGISVNRWEPANVAKAIRTGLVDAVQVIYNILDQGPEDELFPLCRELKVGIIARVPFDEGTLTGALTKDSRWPKSDWRSNYFVPENLIPSVERAERLKALVPEGSTLPQMALRFILCEPTVSTTIPGMRKIRHVEENIAASDGKGLPRDLIAELRKHRWDRKPAPWSQ